jgi:hypothetical protein
MMLHFDSISNIVSEAWPSRLRLQTAYVVCRTIYLLRLSCMALFHKSIVV